MSLTAFTIDGFLGGRLAIAQPRRGFRAGHDAVLLAAAVPGEPGSRVLELGSGAGVASLCLAERVPGLTVLGIEIDPALVELARENARRNRMADRVRFEQGDAASLRLSAEAYDHAFFNPPFHPEEGRTSPDPGRALAKQAGAGAPASWTATAIALTKDSGTVTAIIRADRAKEVIAAADDGVLLFPLFPRAGAPPKRAIVQIRKGTAKGVRVGAGLVLHEANGRATAAAEAVLRHGAALKLR